MATRDKWSTNKRIKVGSPNTTSAGTANAKATGFTASSKMTNALRSFVLNNRQAGAAPSPHDRGLPRSPGAPRPPAPTRGGIPGVRPEAGATRGGGKAGRGDRPPAEESAGNHQQRRLHAPQDGQGREDDHPADRHHPGGGGPFGPDHHGSDGLCPAGRGAG